MKKDALKNQDIADSPRDREKLQQEEISIDMPEVKDIPGQENITVPKMKEMADTTISSADEEGEGILDDLNKEDDEPLLDDNTNVSDTERNLLARSAFVTDEEGEYLDSLQLDNTDEDGELLNEVAPPHDMAGSDLDVPGAEDDDANEALGEEDEQNNSWSQPEQDI